LSPNSNFFSLQINKINKDSIYFVGDSNMMCDSSGDDDDDGVSIYSRT